MTHDVQMWAPRIQIHPLFLEFKSNPPLCLESKSTRFESKSGFESNPISMDCSITIIEQWNINLAELC